MPPRTPFQERLARRLQDFHLRLRPHQLAEMERYYEILSRWNARVNLTSLPLTHFPQETLDRLLVEAILASGFVEDRFLKWVDLGSGGGSPAIPMKILRQAAELTLVESVGKKATFLREAVQAIGIPGVRVVAARIEELSSLVELETIDFVTTRAVKMSKPVVESVVRVISPEGRVLHFGNDSEIEVTGFVRIGAHHLVGSTMLTILRKL